LPGTLAAPPATGNYRRSNKPDRRGPGGAGCQSVELVEGFAAALETQFGESPIVRIDLDRLTIEKHGADLAPLI
jgi:hypothetical protein